MKPPATPILLLLPLLLAAAAPRPASAACLSAEVVAVPTVFGNYDPSAAQPRTTTGDLTVTCIGVPSSQAAYDVALGPGTGGSLSPRRMSFLGEDLEYNLYTDASRSVVWGDGSEGSSTVGDSYTLPITGTGVRSYDVYGQVFAGQLVPPGGYADLIFVTVTF